MSGKEMAQKAMKQTSKSAKLPTMSGMNSGKISDLLGKYRSSIAQVLPKHLNADRMIQICTTLIAKNPDIANCTTASIIGAVTQASILGFKPVAALGHCYFVPYNNKQADGSYAKEVQFMIGYKGFIDLCRRSGELKTIHAACVYEGDQFSYQLGLYPELKHVPSAPIESVEKLTHAYAVAHYKDGGYNFVVLKKPQIESLRLRNRSQKNYINGAWKSDYDKMSMAKAIKQLATFMPLSEETQLAVQSDEAIIKPDDFSHDHSGKLDNISVPFEDAEVDEETGEVLTPAKSEDDEK